MSELERCALRTVFLFASIFTFSSHIAAAWTDQDVGTVGTAGSFSGTGSNGPFTVQGAGNGVGGTQDNFNFAYIQVSGNVEIIARLSSQSSANNYASCGLMIRESLSPGSTHSMVAISPGNGVNVVSRSVTNNSAATILGGSVASPGWLRLVRSGSTFAGYESNDGETWTLIGEVPIQMATSAYVGMAVSNNNLSSLNSAIFDNVRILTNVPQRSANLKLWLRSDVGVTLNSGAVSAWMDQSGNGNNVNAGSAMPTLATGVINGQPVVRFNGTSQTLIGQTNVGLQPATITMMAVYRMASAANTPKIISQNYYPSTQSYSAPFASWELVAGSGTGFSPYSAVANASPANLAGPTSAATGTNPALLEGVYNQVTHRAYLNGVLLQSNSITGPIMYGGGTTFDLGSDNHSPPEYLNGDIAEVLVFNTALTDQQRQQVEAYFSQKYGSFITQPQAGTPVITAPSSGTYASTQSVSLTPGNAADIIYYTLDGSDPATSSTRYFSTSLVTISVATSMQVRAIETGPLGYVNNASTFSATYTIDPIAVFAQIVRPQLWLRADVGTSTTTNGAAASSWTDQSGNGNNVSAGSAAPTFATGVINGQPVMRFASGQYLAGTTSSGLKSSSITMMAVYRLAATGSWPQIISQAYNNISSGWNAPFSSWSLTAGTGSNSVPTSGIAQNTSGSNYSTNISTALNTPYVLEETLDSGAGTSRTYLNGGLANSAAAIQGPIIYGNASTFELGSDYNNESLTGDIAEVLVFNSALSDQQRQQVEAYLYHRYSITGASPSATAPQVSLATGIYSGSQTVTINSGTYGDTIYYTTDGTDPSNSATRTSTTVAVGLTATTSNSPLTIRAIESNPTQGYSNSAAVSDTYTIDPTAAFQSTGLSPQLWLRADAGVTASGSVSQWLDQSGNAIKVTPVATGPSLVTNVINGKPVLHFASGQCLAGPTTSGLKSSSITMMAVYRLTATGSWPQIISQAYNNIASGWNSPFSSWSLTAGTGNNSVPTSGIAQNTSGSNYSTNVSTTLSNPYVLEEMFDSVAGTSKTYLNGTLENSATPTPGSIIYGNASTFEIGSDYNNESLTGDIAEVLVFNSALSDAQRRQVDAYFYQRYGTVAEPQAIAPTLGLPAGTYGGTQTVALSAAPGTTIYYTTTGGTPATLYTQPLNITSTTTLTYMASGPGFTNSTPLSAVYTIDPSAVFAQTVRPQLWLRADVGTGTATNGATVSAWTDQSGNGNNVSAGSATPTFATGVINGQPVIRFASGQYLAGPTSSGLKSSSITIMAVYRLAATGSWPEIISQAYNNSSSGWSAPFSSWSLTAGMVNNTIPSSGIAQNSNGSNFSTNTSTTLGTPYVLEETLDSAAGTSKTSLNGISNTATAIQGPIIYGSASTFEIGSDYNNEYLTGDIAEVLVFNSALSDQQRQQVEAYLYHRYSITGGSPPASAPQVSLAPGIYSSPQNVTINSGTAGDTVYFTTDGTDPSSSSTRSSTTGPTVVVATTSNSPLTIRAIESSSTPGYSNSVAISDTYTIDQTAAFQSTGLSPQLWLRADAGVTASGSVSQWLDQSGNAIKVTPVATGPALVTNVINGKPVLRFASGQCLAGPTTSGLKSSSITMMAVYRLTATGSWPQIISQAYNSISSGWNSPFSSWSLTAGTGNNSVPTSGIAQNSSGSNYSTNVSTTLSSPYVLEEMFDSVAGTSKTYLNGSLANTATPTPGPIIYGSAPTFEIGSDYNNESLTGDIAEVLVFNTALSDAQRRQVDAYFYQRYGTVAEPQAIAPTVSLPAGTYGGTQTVALSAAPGTTIYYTTTGGTPATLYTQPLNITSTTTLTYMASGPGFTNSTPLSAVYTIDPSAVFAQTVRPQLWLRADVGTGTTTNGATVSAWTDQSGNGNNVSAGSGAPTLATGVINGQPVVRFNGTLQTLVGQTNAGLRSSTITMMAVYRMASAANTPKIISQNYYPSTQSYSAPFASWELVAGKAASGNPYSAVANANPANSAGPIAGTATSTNPALLEGVYDQVTHRAYLNGTLLMSNSITGAIMYGGGTTFDLGSDNASSHDYLNGDIAEVLVFNTALSDQQRQQVEAYLLNKYGIQAQPALSPIFNVPSNSLSAPGEITISYPSNSIVYYTTDGSTPTPSSNTYSGPIYIPYTETIKAIAYQNGYPIGSVQSITYTLSGYPSPVPGNSTAPTINLQLPTNATPSP